MNTITIAGNITRDAELRFLPDGSPVASFSVADNQGKDKDAIFWNASIFGKRAESLAQYLVKGQAVTITGNVTERKFNDKQTGAERRAFDVRVVDLALQGGKREGQEAPRQQQKPAPKSGGFDDFEDAPF